MGKSRWVAKHILIYAIGFHSFLLYFWLAAFDPSNTASGMALAAIPMMNFLGLYALPHSCWENATS